MPLQRYTFRMQRFSLFGVSLKKNNMVASSGFIYIDQIIVRLVPGNVHMKRDEGTYPGSG